MKKIKLLAFVALVGLLSACGEEAKPTPKSIDILLDGKIVKTINAEIGDSYSLTAHVNPLEASKEVSWKISDPEIGTISEAGVLDIEKEGEAVITASSLINPNITTNLYLFVAEPVQQTGVDTQLLEEVRSKAFAHLQDSFQQVHRLDRLLVVVAGNLHGLLHGLLRFDCKIVKVHMMFSFLISWLCLRPCIVKRSAKPKRVKYCLKISRLI